MQAVILEGFDEPLTISSVEPLPLGPNDVRVEVQASGVCHSDLSATRGQYNSLLPQVLGHEGCGLVTEVGASVAGYEVGDRVVGAWISSCGHCYQCIQGRSHLCETQQGLAARPKVVRSGQEVTAMCGMGTMAELMTADAANLVKVETDLPDDQLALVGCAVTTGVGAALWTAQVQPGASVAVFGCGGVGLCTVMGAHIAGAGQIIAVDPFPLKRKEALRHGASDTVDPAEGDVVEQVRARTDGRGVEYAFEVIGRLDTMRQVFDATCNGGIVTYVGALPSSRHLELPANALRAQGKQIRGSNYGSAQVRRDMPRLVKLAESGRLDLSAMVSKKIPLHGVNEAMKDMEAGSVIRSVLVP